MSTSKQQQRKRIIVFAYEGKNNKTEKSYFNHYVPSENSCLLKHVSCGNTDPEGMVKSIKRKRKEFDYKSDEDLTFIFMDIDNDPEKLKKIADIKKKLDKNTFIIESNPCFETWFLNHFEKFCQNITSKDLIHRLKKYIADYEKNLDVFELLEPKQKTAIENSKSQTSKGAIKPFSEVGDLLTKAILKKK
ncbi:MAG: RloB family protein [Erysipelotrichaceae bacterium]|jgi:hypothetical protein|nr:RloB family protein [Erysipelotrichaceae bacterium]